MRLRNLILILFVLIPILGCPLPIVPEDPVVEDPNGQTCRVEWYGGVQFNNYEELCRIVQTASDSSSCTALNILCIYFIPNENGECQDEYVFETLDDIPKQSLKGKCDEYVIYYGPGQTRESTE